MSYYEVLLFLHIATAVDLARVRLRALQMLIVRARQDR